MSPSGAARVKHQIVKIPEREFVVALREPEIAVSARVDLEKDLAIDQQSEKFDARKSILLAECLDCLRRREQSKGRGNPGIANSDSAPERGDFSTTALPRRRR